MKVICLFILLLFALSLATAGQERSLITEAPASYFASIKSGQVESRGGIRVSGTYRDIFDTKNWGSYYQHIWRVYIHAPLKFTWTNEQVDIGRVELIVHEMSLSQRQALSALVVNVNNQGEKVFGPAVPIRRTVLDITRQVKRGENVVELKSKNGTNLLHGRFCTQGSSVILKVGKLNLMEKRDT